MFYSHLIYHHQSIHITIILIILFTSTITFSSLIPVTIYGTLTLYPSNASKKKHFYDPPSTPIDTDFIK